MDKNSITIEHIESLSKLSGLKFTDEERTVMLREVSGIIEMLNTCANIEVDDNNKRNIVGLEDLRLDEIKPSLDKNVALSQVREIQDDFVAVPKEDVL